MSSPPLTKRLKTTSGSSMTGPLIATHNGHFHADEALAVYLLRLLPTYQSSRLIRTRDPALLSTAHTVVDVGGEYSPPENRYDHHQRSFTTTFPTRETKLSSAGLIYLHFGKEIIAKQSGLDPNSSEAGVLWEKLYEDFIEALDAQDNGISAYDPKDTKSLRKRFHDGGIGLGSLVGDLNAHYDEDEEEDEGKTKNGGAAPSAEQVQVAEDERFLQASTLMGEVFLRKLKFLHRSWLPARERVHHTYQQRKEFDDQGRLMVFQKSCPWKDHLYSLEEQNADAAPVLYVLYPESEEESSKWRIQAVAVSKDSFESRKALPAPWRGVRDQDLSQTTGIDGCIFVHASGFIGGHATRQGALAMARTALDF